MILLTMSGVLVAAARRTYPVAARPRVRLPTSAIVILRRGHGRRFWIRASNDLGCRDRRHYSATEGTAQVLPTVNRPAGARWPGDVFQDVFRRNLLTGIRRLAGHAHRRALLPTARALRLVTDGKSR